MSAREVYEHAPLAMVVAEVQFTHEPRLADAQNRESALASVRAHVPILNNKRIIDGPVFVPGREAPAEFAAREILEAIAVDGSTLVTISPEAVSISMTGKAYSLYENSLRPLVGRVLDGIAPMLKQVAIRRVGLRYLDELRVPDPPADAEGWGAWVNPSLLPGAGAPVRGTVTDTRSTFVCELGGGGRVQVAGGTFEGNTVIADDHPFASSAGANGPIFVIDVDASWHPSGGFVMFDLNTVKAQFDKLHAPTSGLFEWTITDKARQLFRGAL